MYTKERTHLLTIAKSDVGSGLGIADKSGRHRRRLYQQGFFDEKKTGVVGTTDLASGCVASERPSLLESWDSFTLGDRERGRVWVWVFGGLVSNGKFQLFLCFCWGVWVGAAVTTVWRRGKDQGGGQLRRREKIFDFMKLWTQTHQIRRNSGRALKNFKGETVFLSFGEVSKFWVIRLN